MRLGYARVSTGDQTLDGQCQRLSAVGCEKLFEEKISGARRNRPKLEKLIEQLRKGDILVVTRLDRLARSTSELLRIAERLTEKSAGLQSLDEPWADTTSPSGRMVMTIFAGIAEFERTLILSRTTDGRLAAKARGVAFGRPKKCVQTSRNWPENSSERGSRSAPLPGPSTSTRRRFTASSRDRSLMLLFCSSQPHRPFAGSFDAASWDAWRVFLKALEALPMDAAELAIYRHHTGRTAPPTKPARYAELVAGRRGGKSRILATIATYLGCVLDHSNYIVPGETPVIAIIAKDRDQAKVIKNYIVGFMREIPAFADMIEDELAETVRLSNGAVVEVHTASIGAPRGRTFLAVLCDETAFWPMGGNCSPRLTASFSA
jgi:DNA invertase Pin-like site-specific DNA recombinase